MRVFLNKKILSLEILGLSVGRLSIAQVVAPETVCTARLIAPPFARRIISRSRGLLSEGIRAHIKHCVKV